MLTTQQLQAIKAAILADPALSAFPNNSDGNFEIAAAFNQQATPAFYVWRTSVAITEIMQNGFDWTRVDNLRALPTVIWEFMTAAGSVNPSLANVRAGFIACFNVAADLGTRQGIFNHSQRLATRAEKLLATGSGTTSTDQGVGPATMGFEGLLSFLDVEAARNLT